MGGVKRVNWTNLEPRVSLAGPSGASARVWAPESCPASGKRTHFGPPSPRGQQHNWRLCLANLAGPSTTGWPLAAGETDGQASQRAANRRRQPTSVVGARSRAPARRRREALPAELWCSCRRLCAPGPHICASPKGWTHAARAAAVARATSRAQVGPGWQVASGKWASKSGRASWRASWRASGRASQPTAVRGQLLATKVCGAQFVSGARTASCADKQCQVSGRSLLTACRSLLSARRLQTAVSEH